MVISSNAEIHINNQCLNLSEIHHWFQLNDSKTDVLVRIKPSASKHNLNDVVIGDSQGFMQDKIIASHTCFVGHMDVNC